MKQVVKLLKPALNGRNLAEVITDLQLSAEDFNLIIDGSMEISPVLAMKLEQVLGVDAHQILSSQAADQLKTLGHQRIEKALKAVEKSKRTDGKPSQSPMYGEHRSQTGRAVG